MVSCSVSVSFAIKRPTLSEAPCATDAAPELLSRASVRTADCEHAANVATPNNTGRTSSFRVMRHLINSTDTGIDRFNEQVLRIPSDFPKRGLHVPKPCLVPGNL